MRVELLFFLNAPVRGRSIFFDQTFLSAFSNSRQRPHVTRSRRSVSNGA